jgi:transposase InsO family protein
VHATDDRADRALGQAGTVGRFAKGHALWRTTRRRLWSTIKVELMYWPGTTFADRAEAEHALIRYIDGWYNLRRIQAGLGGLSPDEYEETYYRAERDHHR